MIASLMMYARPELEGAIARYWARIRGGLAARGIQAPERLTQDAPVMEVWRDPALVLSQTCGMPFRLFLHEHVALVGTPDFGVEGCAPGYYRSALVVRAGEDWKPEGARLAFNEAHSQSGFAAAYGYFAPKGQWFERKVQTGAHLASALAVCEGRADVAALDEVSWRLIRRYEGFAEGLRVLDWTEPTPGLPLITAMRGREGEVFDAVAQAIERLSAEDREALCLKGIVRLPKDAYLSVANPPHGA